MLVGDIMFHRPFPIIIIIIIIIITDNPGSCERDACNCDVIFAECAKANWGSYSFFNQFRC